jgi:hypothetical protein
VKRQNNVKLGTQKVKVVYNQKECGKQKVSIKAMISNSFFIVFYKTILFRLDFINHLTGGNRGSVFLII